jgi:uncharacterized protein
VKCAECGYGELDLLHVFGKRHAFVPIAEERNHMSRSRIQTYTGRSIDPMDPSPDDIAIEDIAHALSMTCRYTGHTKQFYSVAEHSLLVSRAVPPQFKLWGLLHDASEAYICDIARPVKRDPRMAPYLDIEANLMRVIAQRFGLPERMPDEVKIADTRMLSTEAPQIYSTPPRPELWAERLKTWAPYPFNIEFLDPQRAEAAFRMTFDSLVQSDSALTA